MLNVQMNTQNCFNFAFVFSSVSIWTQGKKLPNRVHSSLLEYWRGCWERPSPLPWLTAEKFSQLSFHFRVKCISLVWNEVSKCLWKMDCKQKLSSWPFLLSLLSVSFSDIWLFPCVVGHMWRLTCSRSGEFYRNCRICCTPEPDLQTMWI